jgi:hypothetical protein
MTNNVRKRRSFTPNNCVSARMGKYRLNIGWDGDLLVVVVWWLSRLTATSHLFLIRPLSHRFVIFSLSSYNSSISTDPSAGSKCTRTRGNCHTTSQYCNEKSASSSKLRASSNWKALHYVQSFKIPSKAHVFKTNTLSMHSGAITSDLVGREKSIVQRI